MTGSARVVLVFEIIALAMLPSVAYPWGDEGHEIVGEVATHFLQPAVRARIDAMLAADTGTLTAHDFVSETTWADRYRDSDRSGTKIHFLQTRQWHFVDIEVADGDIDSACFGHPPLGSGTLASSGPASDCSIDKIAEFATELASPVTSPAERLLALKFLMHFIGDLHQPLHSADRQDAGGNAERVTATGLGAGVLHGFWDRQLVERLGADPVAVGDGLAATITAAQVGAWSIGTPTDWARESFEIAKNQVYGTLPTPAANGSYALPASYVTASKGIIALQLSRAGVRLALVLNGALRE